MNFRTVCASQALTALAAGVTLLVIPGLFLGVLGLKGPEVEVLGRFAGAMLLALGATLWPARDEADARKQRTIAVGNAAADALVFLFLGAATLQGVVASPWGWLLAGLFGLNVASWGAVAARGS